MLTSYLVFLCFPCVGVRLVYWSLRSTATFEICFHWSLLLACSLHFSSYSAFLRSLFTQSSHLSCGLPRFLQPSCFFVSDIFGNISSFILTMCPSHFIRLLIILPTIQALVPNFFSQVFHSPFLHFPYSGCSPYPVVLTYSKVKIVTHDRFYQ